MRYQLWLAMKAWAKITSVVFIVLAVIAAPLNPMPGLVLLVMGVAIGLFGWRTDTGDEEKE